MPVAKKPVVEYSPNVESTPERRHLNDTLVRSQVDEIKKTPVTQNRKPMLQFKRTPAEIVEAYFKGMKVRKILASRKMQNMKL
jgi:hypothetical protein